MEQKFPDFEKLCKFIADHAPDLYFNIFDIGARSVSEEQEPFYKLLDYFPDSKITAFEIDETQCESINNETAENITCYPVALGGKNGKCNFYEARQAICSSLYMQNDELINNYNHMEVALYKSVSSIKTVTMDDFVDKNSIGTVDFIKIDVQGAEMDIYKGGVNTLENVVFIVSEIEFIPLYSGQPLFGDVCNILVKNGFMFHKFINLCGRTLKPMILNNEPTAATQLMWGDAVFITDINKLSTLTKMQLLKLGILAYLYGSPDLTFRCFTIYDEIENMDIARQLFGN